MTEELHDKIGNNIESPADESAVKVGTGEEEEVATKPAPEETENTIRIRVRNPGDFENDNFSTIIIGDKDQGIKAVIGKLKGKDTTTVQSYVFDKEKWNMERAKAWVAEHKKNIDSKDLTGATVSELVPTEERPYVCECLECEHQMLSAEHCLEVKCSECGGEMRRAERSGPGKSIDDDVVIVAGETAKALGDGRIGGYLVRFSGADDPDLEQDFFDAETDFDLYDGKGYSTVYYQHGMDPVLKRRKLGRAPLKVDNVGIWAETQLAMRDAYERMIYQMAEEDQMGWSSGTASHLVERTRMGDAWHIDRWPLGLDASLTPTPAEPRNAVMPLKSLDIVPLPEIPEGKEADFDWQAMQDAITAGVVAGVTAVIGQEDSPGSTEEDEEEPVVVTETTTDQEPDEEMEAETPHEGEEEDAPAEDATDNSREFVILRQTIEEQPEEEPEEGTEMANEDKTVNTVNMDELVKEIGAALTPQMVDAVTKALAAQEPENEAGYTMEDAEGTKSFADYLLCLLHKDKKRLTDVYGSIKAGKDLTEGSGTAGGYTVPAQFLPQLLEVAAEAAVVRPRAFKIAMASNTLQIPVLDQSDAPSAAGFTDFFGGVHAYWTEEGGTKTETEPDFNQIELRARKLAGYTQATEELLADSAVALEQLLMRLFGGIIGWREDYAFLRGTGAGQPLGVLNSGALVTVNRNTANNVNLDDVARMIRCFLPSSMNARKGVWLIHPWVLPEIVQLADAAANVVWIPNARDTLPITLFGMPLITCEKLPTLGTTGDVLLADFQYYILGDRGQTAIAASEHYAFINDLITWRFVHRVDGQPWLRAPLYIDTTNQVSPFVALHSSTT